MMKKKRLGGKTRVGRLMKRLLGDTAGGVLMEYVVLGLLVVAAVAAAVIVFGDSIQKGLAAMTRTTMGETKTAESELRKDRTQLETDIKGKADAHRQAIQH